MNSNLDKDFAAAMIAKLNQSAEEPPLAESQELAQARHNAVLQATGPETRTDLVGSIAQQLKESEVLPADIDRKLNQIRRAAIAQQTNKQTWFARIQGAFTSLLSDLSATSAITATACLTLTIVALFYNGAGPGNNLPLDPEIGLIASADELELYENLDC